MAAKIQIKHLLSVIALAWGTSVYAADLQGTISKVEDEGKSITVKGKDGKETKLKISSKRTTLDGVGSSADLKVGQAVTVTHDGSEAQKLSAKADAKVDAKADAKAVKADAKGDAKAVKADAKGDAKAVKADAKAAKKKADADAKAMKKQAEVDAKAMKK